MGRTAIEDRFAKRVKTEREYRGWSQADLAGRLTEFLGQQIYPTTVAKIESRTGDKLRSIKLDEAVGLARLFETSVEDIIGLSDTPRRGRDEVRELLRAAVRHAAVSINETSAKLSDAIDALVPSVPKVLDDLEDSSVEELREIARDSRLAGTLQDRRASFLQSVTNCLQTLDDLAGVVELSDDELRHVKFSETIESPRIESIHRLIASKLQSKAAGDDPASE